MFLSMTRTMSTADIVTSQHCLVTSWRQKCAKISHMRLICCSNMGEGEQGKGLDDGQNVQFVATQGAPKGHQRGHPMRSQG